MRCLAKYCHKIATVYSLSGLFPRFCRCDAVLNPLQYPICVYKAQIFVLTHFIFSMHNISSIIFYFILGLFLFVSDRVPVLNVHAWMQCYISPALLPRFADPDSSSGITEEAHIFPAAFSPLSPLDH